MHNYYEWLVGAHMASGTFSLLAFWGACLFWKKNIHPKIGSYYEYSIYVGSVISVVLAVLVLSFPREIHPNRPEDMTYSFNIVLLFLAIIPAITVHLSSSLVKEVSSEKYQNKAMNSILTFFFLGGSTIVAACVFAPHAVIFVLLMTYLLILRLLICTYLSLRKSQFQLVRKKYHTLLAFSSGTALHVGLFAGGTGMRFFANTNPLGGLNLFLPLMIGILIEVILTFKYNKRIAQLN